MKALKGRNGVYDHFAPSNPFFSTTATFAHIFSAVVLSDFRFAAPGLWSSRSHEPRARPLALTICVFGAERITGAWHIPLKNLDPFSFMLERAVE